jgi:hypothetical protein
VSFAAITLRVAPQQVIPKVSVYFVMTQSGNFWIRPRMHMTQYLASQNVQVLLSALPLQNSYSFYHNPFGTA